MLMTKTCSQMNNSWESSSLAGLLQYHRGAVTELKMGDPQPPVAGAGLQKKEPHCHHLQDRPLISISVNGDLLHYHYDDKSFEKQSLKLSMIHSNLVRNCALFLENSHWCQKCILVTFLLKCSFWFQVESTEIVNRAFFFRTRSNVLEAKLRSSHHH